MHPLPRRVTMLTVIWLVLAGGIGALFVRGAAAEVILAAPTYDDY